MYRLSFLQKHLRKTDKILEIGPCAAPIFRKSDGWMVYSMDHTNRLGLCDRYRDHSGVNINQIEDVDFIWQERLFSSSLPTEHHGSFSAIVASHVIEHIPDLIGFLHSSSTAASENANLILAIPDKRVCFDYFRPVSTVGQVLQAHFEKRTRHSTCTLWDYRSYLVLRNEQRGWSRSSQLPLKLMYTLEEAQSLVEDYPHLDFVDIHSWVFVPASFELLIACLGRLGLTDWVIDELEIAESTEFYVRMKRDSSHFWASQSRDAFSVNHKAFLDKIESQLRDSG